MRRARRPADAVNAERTAQILRLVASLACLAGSVVTAWLFFTLYWPYRGRFNEAGRHFDATTLVVHHEQSRLLALPAVALLLGAVGLGRVWWIRRQPLGARGGTVRRT